MGLCHPCLAKIQDIFRCIYHYLSTYIWFTIGLYVRVVVSASYTTLVATVAQKQWRFPTQLTARLRLSLSLAHSRRQQRWRPRHCLGTCGETISSVALHHFGIHWGCSDHVMFSESLYVRCWEATYREFPSLTTFLSALLDVGVASTYEPWEVCFAQLPVPDQVWPGMRSRLDISSAHHLEISLVEGSKCFLWGAKLHKDFTARPAHEVLLHVHSARPEKWKPVAHEVCLKHI